MLLSCSGWLICNNLDGGIFSNGSDVRPTDFCNLCNDVDFVCYLKMLKYRRTIFVLISLVLFYNWLPYAYVSLTLRRRRAIFARMSKTVGASL